jgi:hypothetical protein
MKQAVTTATTICRVAGRWATRRTMIAAVLFAAMPVLLALWPTQTTAQGGDDSWVCIDSTGGEHHYDDVTGGYVVEDPDWQHSSKGQDLCLEAHSPHQS